MCREKRCEGRLENNLKTTAPSSVKAAFARQPGCDTRHKFTGFRARGFRKPNLVNGARQ